MGESVAVLGRRKQRWSAIIFGSAKAGEFLAAFELTARGFDVSIAAEGLPYDLVARSRTACCVSRRRRRCSRCGMSGTSSTPSSAATKARSDQGPTTARTSMFALVALNLKRIAFITAQRRRRAQRPQDRLPTLPQC